MAVRWPSQVGASLRIRKQSSREDILRLRHRLLRHQGLQVRRLILRFLRLKIKTRFFFREDRLPLQLGFSFNNWTGGSSRGQILHRRRQPVVDLYLVLLYETRFLGLHCSSTEVPHSSLLIGKGAASASGLALRQ